MSPEGTPTLGSAEDEAGSDRGARRDRALAASAAAAVFARGVTALGSLLSIGLAARALGGDELGVVSVMAGLIVFFGFGDFGMSTMVMTKLPIAQARGDVAEMRRVVTAAISAMVLVACAVAVCGTVSIYAAPWQRLLGAESLSWPELRWALFAFVWTGAIGIVGTVGFRVLAALQQGALVRLCDAGAAVASVLSVAVCSLVDAPMWAYILAFGGPMTVAWLGQLAWVMYRHPVLSVDRGGLDLRLGLGFLRSGVPYAALSLGWVLSYCLDAIVVSSVLGAAQAAVFAIAARLFGLILGTLTQAGQQMWPALGDALTRGDTEWVRRRFRLSMLATGGIASAGSLFLVAFGQPIARIWVGEHYVPPLGLLVAFAVWTVYMTVITQYGYLLMSIGRVWALAGLSLLIAAVNLAASIVLTTWLGLEGPILGNLVGAAVVQLVPTIVLTRRLVRRLGLHGDPVPEMTPAAPEV